MTTTVRDLMETYSRPPLSIDNDGTTARKVWTEEYFPFQQQYVTVWPPQRQAIDAFLGSGTSRSDADSIGLDTPAYPLNVFPQVVATEGDVTRDFDQNIIPAVALAFSGNSARSRLRSNPRQIVPGAPALWLRSLVGSTTSKFVDYQIAMSHKIPSLQEAAVVGEMKKPKVIRRNEWAFEVHAGSVTLRLQQELRAYAYTYNCPQVFIFDSNSLVIIQFRASKQEDIKNEDCPIDCCILPREQNQYMDDQCTMQYAMYLLVWRGWLRLSATLHHKEVGPHQVVRTRINLSLNGYTRSYIYWSGEPVWRDAYRRQYDSHPYGYTRDFLYRQHRRRDGSTSEVQGFWVWVLGDETIDDTLDCFISGYSQLLAFN